MEKNECSNRLANLAREVYTNGTDAACAALLEELARQNFIRTNDDWSFEPESVEHEIVDFYSEEKNMWLRVDPADGSVELI